MTVTPEDLRIYLALDDIDPGRAQMLITDVFREALTIATVGTVPDSGPTWDNLPTGADAVIRAAAGRLYLNPAGVTSETMGPYSVTRSAMTGSVLSRRERAKLRRLAGRGGAFSIDMTPATAMKDVIDPLATPTVEDSEEVGLDQGWL
ncbi:MAG TPA: hypothetical protein VHB02_06045 [Acidimicrobiales bacterium]|nr:hypothetical protein [Acidimicrobiales bacterium]